MWRKYHSLEKDPGVAMCTQGLLGSIESRGHSEVFEGRGVLQMASVSSTKHGRNVWMVHE